MLEGLAQPHARMLHQIRNAQRRRPADAGHTVHHRAAAGQPHLLQQIGHLVEVAHQIDVAAVQHRHLVVQRSRGGQRRVGQLRGGVHHARDVQLLDEARYGYAGAAQVERRQHLGDAGQSVDAAVGCVSDVEADDVGGAEL